MLQIFDRCWKVREGNSDFDCTFSLSGDKLEARKALHWVLMLLLSDSQFCATKNILSGKLNNALTLASATSLLKPEHDIAGCTSWRLGQNRGSMMPMAEESIRKLLLAQTRPG